MKKSTISIVTWTSTLTTSGLPDTAPWCKAVMPNLFTSFTDEPNSGKRKRLILII